MTRSWLYEYLHYVSACAHKTQHAQPRAHNQYARANLLEAAHFSQLAIAHAKDQIACAVRRGHPRCGVVHRNIILQNFTQQKDERQPNARHFPKRWVRVADADLADGQLRERGA